jgi:aldose 1-epimerase
MRTEGRHRRLRTGAGAGVVAVAALAVIGGLAATRAPAASNTASHPQGGGSPTITKQYFGSTIEPYTGKLTPTYRYTLTNSRGMQIRLLSFGAITQSIVVPDNAGQKADVILGFKTLQDYVTEDSPPVTVNGGPYFGETIGRYGNRIAKGTFQLKQPDGVVHTYTVPVNNGVNSLHGGLVGFGDHIWSQVGLISTPSTVGVTLQLVSPNNDQAYPSTHAGCTSFPQGCTGYPAQITVDVTFTLNNQDQYGIHYHVVNDSNGQNGQPDLNTVINLTNHSYFNLQGEASPAGSAYGQYLTINANKYTPTDTTQIPLGYEASVKGTPFNFLTPHTIGSRIDDVSANFNSPGYNQLLIAQGYDHNWVLNPQTPATTGPDGLNLAARAFDPVSGRQLTVWTDQPGVQVYTSNFLTGTLVGISGHTYRQGAAYTFETQHFPNSPNQPNFPSTELAAGATFNSTTIFAFTP